MTRRAFRLATLPASLLLALPVGAAKVPRSLCLSMASTVPMAVTLKRTGTLRTADGKRTFFTIAGQVGFPAVIQTMPLSGSGYLSGDVLRFSLSGADLRELDSHFSAVHYQGAWDVAQRTGVISVLFLSDNAGAAQSFEDLSLELAETSCDGVPFFE
jgi:hypothetical protein